MNKITKSIQLLLVALLFCSHYILVGQTLVAPVIAGGVGSACDDTGSKNFPVDVSFRVSAFNSDNIFYIELSDADGNFPTNVDDAVKLATLNSTAANNYNQLFNFTTNLLLPAGTFGKNYKIRVRTTSPEMIMESASFEAYHDMVVDSEVGINNDEDFALCNGESKEVSLTTDVVGEYKWYKVGTPDTLVGTTQDPKFTITQPGTYYTVIDYGLCGEAKSRFIKAIGVSNTDAQIKGASTIEICGDQAHAFEANSNNSDYTYEWYKDDELKQSLKANTYTTETSGQFGTYHLVVKLGDCEVKSSDVVLKQKEEPSFTIKEEVALIAVILPNEEIVLKIRVEDVTNYTIQWFKDGNVLAGNTEEEFTARVPGNYVAKVIDTDASGGSCEASKSSEPMVLLAPVSFETEIRADNYEECTSEATVLKIRGIKAKATDGNSYDLTDAQLNATPALITYQWQDSSGAIAGETNNEYIVNSYLNNGGHTLNVKASFINSNSNELDIKLIKEPEVTSTSASNSLCAGGTITYTIDALLAGYTYEWFKDGVATALATNVKDFDVAETGEYTLKQTGYGCEKIVETKNVVPFDDSAIVVSPSEKVVLVLGNSVTITASGAESYVWYKGTDTSAATGIILSRNETFDATALGFYTVVATVGNCTVTKTIEVVEQDDQIIVPNAITPNGDGKNDTWKISNKYAFKPSVTIMFYNANGKEIFKTTDYKNNWPIESVGNQKVFYYKMIREDKLIKAGTISVLH